jgi:hypothetical protein
MNAWQDIAALACVALAAAYIVWRVARKLVKRSGSSCGGCSSCGTSETTAAPKQLVSLAPPKPNKSRE